MVGMSVHGVNAAELRNPESFVGAGDKSVRASAIGWLRRGTTHFVEVNWKSTAVGPIKEVAQTRFFGIGRDLKITVDKTSVTIGLEDEVLIEVNSGPEIHSCYIGIPQEFALNKLGPKSPDPVLQRSNEFRAARTQEALEKLAADLERNPRLYNVLRR